MSDDIVERTPSSHQEDHTPHDKEKSANAASPAVGKKPSLLKRVWAKAGLDPVTILLMAKFVPLSISTS
jgi:hypothetical protein